MMKEIDSCGIFAIYLLPVDIRFLPKKNADKQIKTY